MRLFNKQAKPETTDTSYQDLVDYLRGISQQEYTSLLKVVNIYRDADKAVKKVLGVKYNVVENDADLFLDTLLSDDDTAIGNFLEDDAESPASGRQRKVAQKATTKAKK